MRMDTSFRKPRRGFTLLELLVVIAIIALLISILMPALSGAKRKAITLKCQTNLRLLAEAVNVYTERNQNKYPDAVSYPFFINSPNINNHATCLPHRIHRVRLTPDDPTRIYAAWYCPVKGQLEEMVQTGHGTYAYNQRDLYGVPQSKLPQTSKIGILRDLTAVELISPANTPTQKAHYFAPHDSGQNIVFLDTHVEYSKVRKWLEWGGGTGGASRFPYWKANQTP
jgi:prepilin-type N-terminal cleavage/methylation domain-containing protein